MTGVHPQSAELRAEASWLEGTPDTGDAVARLRAAADELDRLQTVNGLMADHLQGGAYDFKAVLTENLDLRTQLTEERERVKRAMADLHAIRDLADYWQDRAGGGE